jgi:hypothetical protein
MGGEKPDFAIIRSRVGQRAVRFTRVNVLILNRLRRTTGGVPAFAPGGWTLG